MYACPDALVSVPWLVERLDMTGIKPVDGTWFLPPTERNARDEFDAGHIPGAVYFDIDRIADQTSGLPHTLPSPAEFAAAVGELGIGNDDHVIVYDAQGIYSAPRVWWLFRVFGHERVSVLDGGLPYWRQAGFDTTAEPTNVSPVAFEARLRPQLLVLLPAVREAVEKQDRIILDSRPPGRFDGRQPEPRPGVRSGHMPGAVCLHYADILSDGDSFLPAEALAARFRSTGLAPNSPAVLSCGSGVTACTLAMGLYLIGHRDWAVYDGSWSEWGSRSDTPVEVATT